MINLSRFAKMSFVELTSLPNYYIHTIYKLFVNDAIEREKKAKEDEKKSQAMNKSNSNNGFAGNMRGDSEDVKNLRAILAGENDIEELLEELDE